MLAAIERLQPSAGGCKLSNCNGQLLFDPDGNGAKAAFVIATLTGHPTLTADDILVV